MSITKDTSLTAALRARILAGELRPGDRLREAALAERYAVARHTVRAALRALAAERLVAIAPNRGAAVARLDEHEIQALFELRTALEVEAVRLLRERAALDPWPARVEERARALEAACGGPDPDRAGIDAAHAALHHALVAAAGSERITAAHAGLAAESRLVLLQSRATLPVGRMAEAHRELLAGLRAEGPAALRRHLGEGRRLGSAGGTPIG